jgi:putative endopeptidase
VLRNPYASYHKMPVADLAKYTGDLDWPALFRGVGRPGLDSRSTSSSRISSRPSPRSSQDGAGGRLAGLPSLAPGDTTSPYLSEPFVQENFHFYSEILTGTTKMLPRWKRVVAEVDGDVGEALGQLYVAEYFPPEAKAAS